MKRIRDHYRVQYQRVNNLNVSVPRKSTLAKTWKNKLMALFLIFIGYIPLWSGRDSDIFLLCYLIAIPLFFARRNWI